jgi:hypothetical protein
MTLGDSTESADGRLAAYSYHHSQFMKWLSTGIVESPRRLQLTAATGLLRYSRNHLTEPVS